MLFLDYCARAWFIPRGKRSRWLFSGRTVMVTKVTTGTPVVISFIVIGWTLRWAVVGGRVNTVREFTERQKRERGHTTCVAHSIIIHAAHSIIQYLTISSINKALRFEGSYLISYPSTILSFVQYSSSMLNHLFIVFFQRVVDANNQSIHYQYSWCI